MIQRLMPARLERHCGAEVKICLARGLVVRAEVAQVLWLIK